MHTIVAGGALRLRTVLRSPEKAPPELAFLARRFTPRAVFLEVGAEDCALAVAAAGYVERVYAADVSGAFFRNVAVPLNVRLVRCDGVRLPLPDGSVDVAWSGRFLDRLSPAERLEHLRSARRCLAAGGVYLSAEPGPFREAGFSSVKGYAGRWRVPLAFARRYAAAG